MNKHINLVIFLFVLSRLIFADSVAPNQKYTEYSQNGKFLIEMIPSSNYGDEGEGRVYTAIDSAKGEFLWKVDWYGYVSLMNDGEHLVRFGPWAEDMWEFTDLAISFYKRDSLINEYLVKNLLKDKSTISETSSHYTWEAKTTSVSRGFSENRSTYTIVTSDKTVYIFDIYSGGIANSFIDTLAKTSYEIFEEERRSEQEEGLRLLRNTKSSKLFEDYFSFSQEDIYVNQLVMDTVTEWSVDLYPTRKGKYPWFCEFRTPISGDSLVIRLKPEDIYGAYNDFISAPFIRKFLNGSKNITIRIRVENDMLHWTDDEIDRYKKSLLAHAYPVYNIKDWIRIIIDFHDYGIKDMISFYRPLNGDYYIMDYLTAVPKTLANNKLTNGEDVYTVYCWYNCVIFDKAGNMNLIPWTNRN
jgi:hypothetical protein